MFFDELYHVTTMDPNLHDILPEHLTFLMDEFNNITLPDSFVDRLSTMRSRGMSAIVIIQNLMQLKNKFPEHDLDKNLIGNMSIVDILGAPDVDSCEYLSKLFGTMTIHKQTTGLSTGSQSSFSRNEDVMQKPLFSQEDMFGMDKDGPCAIAIKGTNPLWVQKCKFEESSLYPLLTRKKPYRTKQNRIVVQTLEVNRNKSLCEQLPEIYIGEEAEAFVRQCREDDITVIRISEKEINALATLDANKIPLAGKDASTKEFWRKTFEQTAQALADARKNTLDLDSYNNEQLIVVQRLRNAGFEPVQINGLNELIMANYPFNEIVKYFGVNMTAEEIKDFAGRLAKLQTTTTI
jgi:type IV secretion system protein VirD4